MYILYILRRAAVRALSQPSKSLSTFRPISTRVTTFQCAKPTLYRGFHQTRIWQADEQEKTPEERAIEQEKLDEIAPEELSDHEKQQILEGQEAQEAQDAALSQQSTLQEVVEPATNPPESAHTAAYNETPLYEQPPPQEPLPATFAPSGSGGMPGARMPGPTADIKPSRILYVGNIFFEVTAAQLETEFSRFGEIANSRIVTDSRGLSKGFAYVEFASQDAADKAVRGLNQKVFQGRRMAVQYHIPRERQGFAPRRRQGGPAPPGQPSKVLFIGNMSYQMSDRDLNDLFREIRDVLDVRVAIDRRSGQPRGFAHADFIDVESAQRAKEHLEKKVIYGRQLRVDFSSSSSMNSGAATTE